MKSLPCWRSIETRSLGLDVGGANTKAVLLEDGEVQNYWLKYIPLWKNKEALNHFLESLSGVTRPQVVGATLTGEICDIFRTKHEGVIEIVETICRAFGEGICLFVSSDNVLFKREQSLTYPGKLAAANWIASTLIVGRKYPDCIFIDIGSTTTDIIPLKGGRPAPLGWTDIQRLRTGELIYTGVLRTPLPFICSEVLFGDEKIGTAAENFAITADVYRVLGMIEEEDYVCETPDGRGRDKDSCMRRIARIFCSDLEEIGEERVMMAAEVFHDKQVNLVASGLQRVMVSHGLPKDINIVVAGLGRKAIAEKAVRLLGLNEVVDLANLYGEKMALMMPAFGAGLLAAKAFEDGRCG